MRSAYYSGTYQLIALANTKHEYFTLYCPGYVYHGKKNIEKKGRSSRRGESKEKLTGNWGSPVTFAFVITEYNLMFRQFSQHLWPSLAKYFYAK